MPRNHNLSRWQVGAALAVAAQRLSPVPALAQPPDPFISALPPPTAPRPSPPAVRPVPRQPRGEPAQSQPPPSLLPGWVADKNTGCRIWAPNLKPDETVTWAGPCQNGVASGTGIREWRGSYGVLRFEGNHTNGRRSGIGTMTWANGDSYVGEWANGQRTGTGTMRWVNGTTYTGGWAGDQRVGRGVSTLRNGLTYDGMWSADKPNGPGTLGFPNGGSYVGHWVNGCSSSGSQRMNFFATRAECGF